MARANFLFFLFLSFLLLGRCNYIYAKAVNQLKQNDLSSPNQAQTKLLHSVKFDQHAILTNISLNEENEYLSDVEDDENLISARKSVLLSNSFILLQYICILNFLFFFIKSSLPNCRYFHYKSSYKYILQRSLRI
ncbi:MAG: hypothetical protein EOP42_09585 [Sphingobacteriaceae bacterium]|nr:MAG: hypothetical protein EOP42_09585 [Sphingobacteriaceae bacterium]